MKLIVMRHGEAEVTNTSDVSRNLTAFGRQQVNAAGRWLAAHVLQSSKINIALVSPYLRAQQTFDCLNTIIEVEQKFDIEALTPDAKAVNMHQVVDQFLVENPDTESMILVSHMPLVCFLLDELLINHQGSLFDTASMAMIEYDIEQGGGEFVSFYHPCMM